MKAPIQPGTGESPELDLLLDWNTELGRRRMKEAAAGSISLHLLALIWILWLPLGPGAGVDEAALAARFRDPTPLVAPPPQLTQRAPNRGLASEEVTLEGLLPRPRLQAPPPSATESEPFTPASEPPVLEPPQIAMARLPPQLAPPGFGELAVAPPPPEIRTEEKPKLAFEKPGSMTFSQRAPSSGIARIPKPSSSVQEAIRGVVRGGGRKGLVVGDVEEGGGIRGITQARGLPPSPDRTGSSLELLSDPKGTDFRPYLIRILASVRRNWRAVMPLSAKLGYRGKVVIQFAIDRSGWVPKLVIASPSGAAALDRAAVAGISASNPFPPLPRDFVGDQIRLQFNFFYNIKR